jgi:C4-dicarboxylate-specific signal transduction histidine kinase
MTDQDFDYRAFFHSAPGLYLVLDVGFRIVTATDSYCHATLTERDVIIGRELFEVFPDNPGNPSADGVRNLRESLERVLQTRRRDAMAVQRYDIRRQDGGFEERHWSPMNVPILDESGAVRWIVHRVRDVTQALRDSETIESQRRLAAEQDNVIAALRAANRELADRDRAPGDTGRLARLDTIALMTSAIAHDMSQPLASAMNYLSAFRRTTKQAGAVTLPLQYVEKAEQQLKRAADIVRGLRSYIAGEKTPCRPESLSEMIRNAGELCEVVFRLRRTEIEYEFDESLPPVFVDRTQIVQVLVNIFNNAAQAMQDRPQRKIHVRTRRVGTELEVDIADTGPGIAPEMMEEVFKPFHSDNKKGLGLGLAICREIMQSHDGALCVRSNEPGGAVFCLTLPPA